MLKTIRSSFNVPKGMAPWLRIVGLVNVIAGGPGTGKTTIIHAIEYALSGVVNDVHGRNELKMKARVALLHNGPLLNELKDENGNDYKGVLLSETVREAMTSDKKGATEFFAAYLDRPFDGWWGLLAEGDMVRLSGMGLTPQVALPSAISTVEARLASARAKVKESETKLTSFPAPAVTQVINREALEAEKAELSKAHTGPDLAPTRQRLARLRNDEARRTRLTQERDHTNIALQRAYDAYMENHALMPTGTAIAKDRQLCDVYYDAHGLLQKFVELDNVETRACPMCGTKAVFADGRSVVRLERLQAFVDAKQQSIQSWTSWDTADRELRQSWGALNANHDRLVAELKTVAPVDPNDIEDLEKFLNQHERAAATWNEQHATRQRRLAEIVQQLTLAEVNDQNSVRRTSWRSDLAEAQQAEASLVPLRDRLEALKAECFEKKKQGLLDRIGEMMGTLNGQPFKVGFRMSPFFAVEILAPAERAGVPSGFTQLRLDVAIALAIAPQGNSVVLVPDRQMAKPEFLEWIQGVGNECAELDALGRTVQVFVQTTLEGVSEELGEYVTSVKPARLPLSVSL